MADLELRIELALVRAVREVADHQRIDGERAFGRSPVSCDEAVPAQRPIGIELASDLALERRAHDLDEQLFIDERALVAVARIL